MNKRSPIATLLLATILLGRAAIGATVKPSDQPNLLPYYVIHFASDNPEDSSSTLGQAVALLSAVNPDCLPVPAMQLARRTIERLLEDESVFNAVFAPFSSCVYIESGEHDADDLAPFFAKYGTRIEGWVCNGGRLLVNGSPPSGRCPLPFGAALVGGVEVVRVASWGYPYSQFYCDPSPLEGGAVVPRNSPGLVSTGRIEIDYAAAPMQRSPIYPEDSFGLISGSRYDNVCSVAILLPEGVLGSAIYASLRGPAALRMAEDAEAGSWAPPISHANDGEPFWNRLLYWAFRSDGFVVLPAYGNESPLPRLVVTSGDPGSYESASATIYALSLGTNDYSITVQADDDWLVVTPAAVTLPPGPFVFASGTNAISVRLAEDAASLPVGVHTGAVSFTRSPDFAADAAARWWARFSDEPPLVDPYVDTFPSAFRVEVEFVVEEEADPVPEPGVDVGTFRLVGLDVTVREEAGAVARVAVVREGGDEPLPAAAVTLATADDSAIAGLDYSSVSNRLRFAEGVTTNIVEIPILDNATLHTYSPSTVAPRVFFVRLSTPSSGASLGAPAALAVSILDDEVPPRSWFVHPASGGWGDADVAALRSLITARGALPAPDVFTETTFEVADPVALFSSASSCVFLDFGPREASYAAAFLTPWRDAIEAWVRSGGRLFVNAAPQGGSCPLPFGLRIEANVPEEEFRRQVNYYKSSESDVLCWLPTALDPNLAVYYAIAPADPGSTISPASVILPDAASLPGDATVWFGHSEGAILGTRDGVSYEGPFLLVGVGAGSVACASLRPPAQLAAGEIGNDGAPLADGTPFWARMVYWAFRVDGFGLAATEDWTPDGVVGEADSFVPLAKTYGALNLGTGTVEVAVSSDVDWLVAESGTATISAGGVESVRVSLAPEALTFPVGSYTGTVTFASSRPFCESADIGDGHSFSYPAPEFRRTVVFTVLPPSGTLAPITVTSVALPKAHPGGTGATAVVATLTNLSAEHAVRIFGCSLSGDGAAAFRIVSPTSFPVEIPAGGSLDILVAFAPEETGLRRATLTIETSDRDHSTLAMTISSRGVPLELEAPILWDGGRGCELMWSSIPDVIYEVLSTDNLTQPFERIGRAVGDDGYSFFFDIREHAPARFYKVRQP